MKMIAVTIGVAMLSGITLLQPARLFAIEGPDEYVAYQHRAADFGSLTVHGPMKVEGDLVVAGDLTVHGPMAASRIEYAQSQSPEAAATHSATIIDGPFKIAGPILVAGSLRVDGPLKVTGRLIRLGGNDSSGR
jgi:cytoskeletal protein CcmA (bactofilin family)